MRHLYAFVLFVSERLFRKSVSNKLQKKVSESLSFKENTQYIMAFGLIATMLLVAGFPVFVIFFFGIFAYFLWKTFSKSPHISRRDIFEFYLSANEILRDDERRWFGFEVQEIINRGERILQVMNGAPPLVYFTLGALYHKIGDFKSAVNHLSYIVENENADEATYVYPTPELKEYVKLLRKIEREPAEAPQTSAAIRALERARRNRGKAILESSREGLKVHKDKKKELMDRQKKQIDQLAEINHEATAPKSITDDAYQTQAEQNGNQTNAAHELANSENETNGTKKKTKSKEKQTEHRQSISELLHDIYDKK